MDAKTDQRCECGALLARAVAEGVEFKCRRCNRIVVMSWKDLRGQTEVSPPCSHCGGSGVERQNPARR